METLSFAFGVLTVIGVGVITVVALGIVKVIKMQRHLESLEKWTERSESGLLDQIQRVDRELNMVVSEDRRELNQRIDECHQYVDSRFDKFENKLNSRFEATRQILDLKMI